MLIITYNMSSNSGWSGQITNVRGSGNNDGAHVGASGQISHPIGSNTSVNISGNIDRSQSFHGGGGQNTYSGSIGITHKF